VIMGKGDADETSAKRAAAMPDGRFEVVPGDHEPWLNDLDACATHVHDFLRERDSRQLGSGRRE